MASLVAAEPMHVSQHISLSGQSRPTHMLLTELMPEILTLLLVLIPIDGQWLRQSRARIYLLSCCFWRGTDCHTCNRRTGALFFESLSSKTPRPVLRFSLYNSVARDYF